MLALAALVLLVMGGWLSACDFNVEITDEKRSLEKVGGTSPCAAGERYSEGKSGTHTLRIFLVDDRQTPEALDLDGIDKEPFNLKVSSFTIPTKDEIDNETITLIDASDGSNVAGATVQLELDTSDLVVQPNPRYSSLKNVIGNKRVPKAVNLLIDMSETSADQDPGLSRTSAPAGWILENFNKDSTVGDLDIFSALLMKSNEVSSADILFKTADDDVQFFASDGRKRGFLLTTETFNGVEGTEDLISSRFTNISNSSVNGEPPVYAAIEAAALDTRAVSRDGDTQEALFNPGLIVISLERDHNLLDSNRANKLDDAIKAVKGENWENDADADFIPMMAVAFPPPEKTTIEDWDKHLDNLCAIAQAGGASRKFYWGQVFHIPPKARTTQYAKLLRDGLDMSYHALKGYIELKVKYTLPGSTGAGRYFVSFKLQGELLDQKSSIENSPTINFEVRVK